MFCVQSYPAIHIRSNFPTVVPWVVTLCTIIVVHQSLEGKCCVQLRGRFLFISFGSDQTPSLSPLPVDLSDHLPFNPPIKPNLNLISLSLSLSLSEIHNPTRRYNPEDHNMNTSDTLTACNLLIL
jgi:hypothetical protein